MKSCLKNILVAVGAYWLSTWAIVPVGVLLDKITDRITYGDSLVAAIFMGVMLSLGRAVAASAAGICVTLFVDGKRPEFWGIIPSVLYATRMFRQFSRTPTSTWYRIMMNVDRFFPAVVCIAVAFFVARISRGPGGQSSAGRA